MELWIKSQDGEFCGVVKEVYLQKIGLKVGNEEEEFLPPYFITCADFVLGKYATVERCKEIIAEISSRLKGAFILKINLRNIKPLFKKQVIDEIINNRNIGIIDKESELVDIKTAYYEMPQE